MNEWTFSCLFLEPALQASIRGNRVLITGASTGIGEQLAYYYAKLGADLLITSRTEAKLQVHKSQDTLRLTSAKCN